MPGEWQCFKRAELFILLHEHFHLTSALQTWSVRLRPIDMRDDHLDLIAGLQGILGGGEPRSNAISGIKALLLAVLEDGIRSYLSPIKEVRTEAEYWVSSSRARSPFCFVVICETLGLEPTAVRQALERLRTQRVNPGRVIGRTRPNVRRAHRVTQREVG